MKQIIYSNIDEIIYLLDRYYDQIVEDFSNFTSSPADVLDNLNKAYKQPTHDSGENEDEDDDIDGAVEDEEVEEDEEDEEEDKDDETEMQDGSQSTIDLTIDRVIRGKRTREPENFPSKRTKLDQDPQDYPQDYFLHRIQHGEFNRDKKLKITILKESARNIFLRFGGFRDDGPHPITDVGEVYAINSADMYEQLSGNHLKASQPSIAISGGIVVPNTAPVFTQIRFEDGQAPIDLLTGDFTSLYPTTCEYANICQSTAAYNPHYAIRIGNYLYDPFDQQCFNQVAAPLKINTCFTSVATFIIRPEIWKSCISRLIGDVKRRRKETKSAMKDVEARLGADSPDYHILDFLQAAYKLLINTLYGIYLSPEYPSYRPYLGTLVTYYGRMALLRFFFSFHYALYKKGVQLADRGVLGGDTDSLFLRCTRDEMVSAIKTFEGWPSNRGVYGVELEKHMWDGVFLGKKNYLMYGSGKFIIKGLFKKSFAPPCRTLLAEALRILCERILRLSQCDDLAAIDREFDEAFNTFDASDESNFTNRQIMKKDLSEYKSNTAVVCQMREIEKRESKTYLRGHELLSSHYDFVFAPNVPNVDGPIDPANLAQSRYIAKHPQCTLLVEDNVEWYKENYKGFAKYAEHVSRKIMLKSNLKTILLKIFKAFARSNINNADLFEKLFCAAYKRKYGQEFFSLDDTKKRMKEAGLSVAEIKKSEPSKLRQSKMVQKKLSQLGFIMSSRKH